MKVFEGNGIHLDGIFVDIRRVRKPPEKAVISHAHSDHVKLNAATEFFLTPETHDLVCTRFGAVHKCQQVQGKKKITLEGFELSFLPAGHILGSVQIIVKNSSCAVYTSDFKLSDSLLLKGAVPVNADTLVIESTFGLPEYRFPGRDELYQEIGRWITHEARNNFVVLVGYQTGKAQELTKLVNEYTNHTPLVHEAVFSGNEVYQKHGKNLGGYYALDHNLGESDVLILPPNIATRGVLQAIEYCVKKPVRSAIASGWGYRMHHDRVFPLSDHAGFLQLLEYVSYSQPKMVYTTHGFERELARSINRRLGIPAKPLSHAQQKSMCEFA